MDKKLTMIRIFMLTLGSNAYANNGDGIVPYSKKHRYPHCNGHKYNKGGHFKGNGYGMENDYSFWNGDVV